MNEQTSWGGLCNGDRSAESIKNADIVVFGIPFDGNVSYRKGAKAGPDEIRKSTAPIPPTTEFFEDLSGTKVVDLGDFDQEDAGLLFTEVQETVAELVKAGKFFTMMGGDHSVTIPVLRGIDQAIDHDFGILHIDAHFDLCDALDGNRLSHGCTERRALELEHVANSQSIFFIGIRSAELDELEFMKKNKVLVINASSFEEQGTKQVIAEVKAKMSHFKSIYLTVDIDSLDPAYAAGTGTPKFGGLTSRQLLDLLKGLFDLPIIAFDVVEVAPGLESAMTSVYAAQRIITECWGHQVRKTKR